MAMTATTAIRREAAGRARPRIEKAFIEFLSSSWKARLKSHGLACLEETSLLRVAQSVAVQRHRGHSSMLSRDARRTFPVAAPCDDGYDVAPRVE
jgi:hypothetical protein